MQKKAPEFFSRAQLRLIHAIIKTFQIQGGVGGIQPMANPPHFEVNIKMCLEGREAFRRKEFFLKKIKRGSACKLVSLNGSLIPIRREHTSGTVYKGKLIGETKLVLAFISKIAQIRNGT